MENAKFEMLRSVKPVEEEDIIKSVLEHGIKETAFRLNLKQCDLIYEVSIYISKMKRQIRNLKTRVFNESLQEDSDVKKIVVEVEKIGVNTHEELTLDKKAECELESNKTSDEEFSCTENEVKEEKDEEKEDGELEEVLDGSHVKKLSMEKIEVNTHVELTSTEKEGELESSKTSDEESTCTENEEKEEEGGLESTFSDEEKTQVTSRRVVPLAEIMLQQAMSTEDNESNLKTLIEKEDGFPTIGSAVAANKRMAGHGYGRGSVFARDRVPGGFGRGHYVRRLQQQQSLVMKEDTSNNDNPVPAPHGGLSMYMENARMVRTRKQKR